MMLLRESFNKDWNIKEKVLIKPQILNLNESNKKVLYENNSYSVLSAFRIPIWILDTKNQNNRVYPYSLGEKIVRENPITSVLDGHPEDDYIVTLKDVIAVAKNPQIKVIGLNKVLFADIYIVDEAYDKKIKKATDLGLFFEESSSGYGELDEKGCVITETYQIERLCDLLVNESSYQVSFSKENEIIDDENINNTTLIDNKNIKITKENKNTNYISDKEKAIKEDYIKEKNYMTFQDKIIKRDIKSSLKEAKGNSNLQEKLDSLKDISTYFQDVSEFDESVTELQKEVNSLKEVTEKEIIELAEKGKKLDSITEEKEKTVKSLDEAKTKIVEAEKALEEKTNELEKVQKQIEMAISEMDKSKEIYNNLKEMYEYKNVENNSLVDPKDYLNLQKQYETTSKKLKIAIDELNKIKEGYTTKEEKLFIKDLIEEKEKTDGKDDKEEDDKKEKDPEKKNGDKKAKDSEDKKDKDDSKEKEDDKDSEDDKKDKDKKEKFKKKESIRHSKINPRQITKEVNIDPKKVFESKNSNSASFKYKKKHKNIKIERQYEKVESYIQDLVNRYGDQISERFMEALTECSTLEEAQGCYLKNRPSLNRIQEIHQRDDSDNDSVRMKRYKESLKNDPIANGNNWL